MKLLWLFICISMCYSMHDYQEPQSDDEQPIRNTHPELYCFRLMEKIEWVMDNMDRTINEFTCKEEYEDCMDYWQKRLNRLESKLRKNEWSGHGE